MKIYGIDFTSTPNAKKAITCVECRLDESGLSLERFERLTSFDAFENFLRQPGAWVAGMDFPFGQPRKLIENIGWPQTWEGYVRQVGEMIRKQVKAGWAYSQRDRNYGIPADCDPLEGWIVDPLFFERA